GEQLLEGLTTVVGAAGPNEGPRGLGLLIGVPVGAGKSHDVVISLLDRGFLATEAGPDVVRVAPPLTVDAGAVDAFCEAFAGAVETSRTVEEARR
ncbi:MAG TPA: hypothetical protein VG602_05385, partial [Actinomycetota bacterium]|nr:hypothetical protein [Actinomycetota bacterium]